MEGPGPGGSSFSRVRAASALYMVFTALHTAPIPISNAMTEPMPAMMVRICCELAL